MRISTAGVGSALLLTLLEAHECFLDDQTKLQLFNIIIGALYMVVLGIEVRTMTNRSH